MKFPFKTYTLKPGVTIGIQHVKVRRSKVVSHPYEYDAIHIRRVIKDQKPYFFNLSTLCVIPLLDALKDMVANATYTSKTSTEVIGENQD